MHLIRFEILSVRVARIVAGNTTVPEDQISRQSKKLIDANRFSSDHETIVLGLLLRISSPDHGSRMYLTTDQTKI